MANHHANFNGKQGKDKWDQTTAPVGSLFVNGYGLYDMVGNVGEWCADLYKKDYYLDSPYKNPKGPDSSVKGVRVLRGGSWLNCAILPAGGLPQFQLSAYEELLLRVSLCG